MVSLVNTEVTSVLQQCDLPDSTQVRAHLLSRLRTTLLLLHQVFWCISTSQGTRPPQAAIWSLFPASLTVQEGLNNSQHAKKSSSIFPLYLIWTILFRAGASSNRGLQERQVADAQPKQARDSANSFMTRIAITALSVFKSLATLDVFIRQVFTAALESGINCSLRKSPYREQVTLVAQNSHQLPTSLGGKGEV